MDIEINIDQDVFGRLQSEAQPFVDTPNSVLRRLLGLEASEEQQPTPGEEVATTPTPAKERRRSKRQTPGRERRPQRAPSGSLLPEERYELPLLHTLVRAGGHGLSRDIIEAVGQELKDDLTPLDLDTLATGAVRWQNRIQFVRLRLIERGLMKRDTPRGVWAISDDGRAYFEAARGGRVEG